MSLYGFLTLLLVPPDQIYPLMNGAVGSFKRQVILAYIVEGILVRVEWEEYVVHLVAAL